MLPLFQKKSLFCHRLVISKINYLLVIHRCLQKTRTSFCFFFGICARIIKWNGALHFFDEGNDMVLQMLMNIFNSSIQVSGGSIGTIHRREFSFLLKLTMTMALELEQAYLATYMLDRIHILIIISSIGTEVDTVSTVCLFFCYLRLFCS